MRRLSIWLLLAVVACSSAISADWPRFRGPNGSGVSDATGLPTEFGPAKNVLWKVDLPPGHSSPVLSGDRIFLTAWEKGKLLTLCVDRNLGKTLWQGEIARARSDDINSLNSPASPSPATDGENVYAFFQDFGLISYSVDGKERWRLPLGPFKNGNGMGASPIVSHGMVLLVCDQDVGSFVLAVKAATGKACWRKERLNTIGAGYATPVVCEHPNGIAHLIVPGTFQLMAYEVDSGEPIWWVNGFPVQPNASPILGDRGTSKDNIFVNVQGVVGMVNLPPFSQLLESLDKDKNGSISLEELGAKEEALGGVGFSQADLNGDGVLTENEWKALQEAVKVQDLLLAVRPGESRGDLTDTKVLWRHRKGLPRVPSPLLYENVLYLIKEGGILTAINPETGEVLKQARLSGALDGYYASPVAADGKLYVASQTGHVVVVKAGRDWEVLAVNDLDDECFATPAIVDGKLYIRTRKSLYCFSQAVKSGR
jgi:hypothetical protein